MAGLVEMNLLLRCVAAHSSSPGGAPACDSVTVAFGDGVTDGRFFGAYTLRPSAVFCGQPVWTRKWGDAGGSAMLYHRCTSGMPEGWAVSERLDSEQLEMLAPLRDDGQTELRMPWGGSSSSSSSSSSS